MNKVSLPEIEDAYQNMVEEKGRSEWVLMTYTSKSNNDLGISVRQTGREISDLALTFKDDKIMYAFAKIDAGGTTYGDRATKVFFIVWVGRKVRESKKKDLTSHKRALASVIKAPHFVEVMATVADEVKEANLLQKLYSSRASMDDASPASPRQERAKPEVTASAPSVSRGSPTTTTSPDSPRKPVPPSVPRPTRALPTTPSTDNYYRPPPTRAAPTSKMQAEKERIEKEERDARDAKEKVEREKEERERRVRERDEQQRREKEEEARAQAEKERRAREESDRRAREESDRRQREDNERRAREENERKEKERKEKELKDKQAQARVTPTPKTTSPMPSAKPTPPVTPNPKATGGATPRGRLVVPPAFLVQAGETPKVPVGPGTRKPMFISPHPPRRPSIDNTTPRPVSVNLSARKNLFPEPMPLSFGLGHLQGKRPTMEDRHSIVETMEKNPHLAFFAVYDGHAGEEAADFVEGTLHKEVDKHVATVADKFGGDVRKAVVKAFQNVDEELAGECEMNYWYSGTTAVTILYNKNERKILCANLGDSRCVFGRGEVATCMSEDHKPNLPREEERIRAAGKDIKDGRIDGSHAFSRALGDVEMKGNLSLEPHEQAISNVPEFQEVQLEPPGASDVEFAVLACDGLWDVMENDEVIAWVYNKFSEGKFRDLSALALELAQHAIDIGSTDNVSVIIVIFPTK